MPMARENRQENWCLYAQDEWEEESVSLRNAELYGMECLRMALRMQDDRAGHQHPCVWQVPSSSVFKGPQSPIILRKACSRNFWVQIACATEYESWLSFPSYDLQVDSDGHFWHFLHMTVREGNWPQLINGEVGVWIQLWPQIISWLYLLHCFASFVYESCVQPFE